MSSTLSTTTNSTAKRARAKFSTTSRPTSKWWGKISDIDPISLELIGSLPYPPFSLHGHFFDGIILAHYILSTGNFVNPMTRQSMDRSDCIRLDKYSRKFITQQGASDFKHRKQEDDFVKRGSRALTDAYDVQHLIVKGAESQGTESQGDSNAYIPSHVTIARREATLLLQNLFGFPNYQRERARKHKKQRKDEARDAKLDSGSISVGCDDNRGMLMSTFMQHDQMMAVQGGIGGSDDAGLVVIDDDQVFWNGKTQEATYSHDSKPSVGKTGSFDSNFPSLPATARLLFSSSAPKTASKIQKAASAASPASSRSEILAQALQVTSNSSKSASKMKAVEWPRELLLWARTHRLEVRRLEAQLHKFLSLPNSSSSSSSRSLQLKPMATATRKLVHQLATVYGLNSASYDAPKKRHTGARGGRGGRGGSSIHSRGTQPMCSSDAGSDYDRDSFGAVYADHALRYVSLVKKRSSSARDIPALLLSEAAAQASPKAFTKCDTDTTVTGIDAEGWVLLNQPQESKHQKQECGSKEPCKTKTGNSNNSNRWANSRLQVHRRSGSVESRARDPSTESSHHSTTRSTKSEGAVKAVDQALAKRAKNTTASALQSSEKVKVGVYNRHEGERIVSLPRGMVHSMVLENETLWHALLSQQTEEAQKYQLHRHQTTTAGCKLEADIVHMWARTACGDACLIQNIPQSHLWV